MATELELKLMVQSEYLKPASEFLDEICKQANETSSRQPTLSLMNGYFDTADAMLMDAGVALRIRAVNQEYIQTLKTRGSSRIGMHARGEWEWQVPNGQLDLSLLNAVPLPESLMDLSWGKDLIEVYRTDFERQVWLIEEQGTQMEVVCDQGVVTSAYGQEPICELEIELKSGDDNVLYEFAHKLAQQVPVQVSTVSKAQKGVRLKHGQIQFPEKPDNTATEFDFAVYWYESWLVYWEAMFYMEDEILIQPIRHSLVQLAYYLSSELKQEVLLLEKALLAASSEFVEDLLPHFGGLKQTGIVMLKVGQWLNQASAR
ncbi:CYTH domain protein [Marinomonas spartinae]|uniref:CYTH domain-containing protein n=1 Tax=Marinomonas spartinae TaxID=1792290 RepID=UPI000808D2B3|nr:CYTH domain-containing protein [Marinomonas spartinae]SBS25915.1 CYTH domain protein [Marinomonas spartinae]